MKTVNYNGYIPDSIVQEIIESFVKRAEMGENKYGTNLERSDLSLEDWLIHSLEEKMDDILYLQKALKVLQESKNS